MSDSTFQWRRHPDGQAYLEKHLAELAEAIPHVSRFAARLHAETGSRLVDWLDHVIVSDGDKPRAELKNLGFSVEEVPTLPGDTVFFHPGTIFPRIVLREGTILAPGHTIAVAIMVEDISFFLMTHHIPATIQGSIVSPYRQAKAWSQGELAFLVVERRGHGGFVPEDKPADYAQCYLQAFEHWATRPRLFAHDREGMEHALSLAGTLVSDLGVDTAAWIAFAAERAYWQRRNCAGQVQKSRQDSLGLGWGNHDHHTFRSSRSEFGLLIKILETFGFRPRERFYAGAEAGWGAQVMEQPVCRFAVFADVDLSPDEVEGDFAHSELAPRHELGTVGLWCALHGESMLQAGLHHLASRFAFDDVTQHLAHRGISMMDPFSDFDYLRQAFTQGERWTVAPERLERLRSNSQIDDEQRTRFREDSAIGSHLENIQRDEGFKGFNQQTVSDIIRRTDPRA